jgi:cytochrome c-type biogenesis protein CcmH
MIWIGIVLLSALAMIPLTFTLAHPPGARGRRESALAFHRAQLAELDRDLADGRIALGEHGAAVLEVQRRLLAVAGSGESRFSRGRRGPVVLALVAVPIASVLLYLAGGSPNLRNRKCARSWP